MTWRLCTCSVITCSTHRISNKLRYKAPNRGFKDESERHASVDERRKIWAMNHGKHVKGLQVEGSTGGRGKEEGRCANGRFGTQAPEGGGDCRFRVVELGRGPFPQKAGIGCEELVAFAADANVRGFAL